MNDAVITFVTTDEDGNIITSVHRVEFESRDDYANALIALEQMAGVTNVEKMRAV